MALAKLTLHTHSSDTVQQAAAAALADAIRTHEKRAVATNSDWLLLLSGGSAVSVAHHAFQLLVDAETQLTHCTVRLADERWGEPWHSESNELALKEAGVLKLIENVGARWHSMLPNVQLHPEAHAEQLASKYGAEGAHATLLLAGMGADAHTAGILPLVPTPYSELYETNEVIYYYELPDTYTGNPFHRRITITPACIHSNCQVLLYATGPEKAVGLQTFVNQSLVSTTASLKTAPVLCLKNAASVAVFTDQILD